MALPKGDKRGLNRKKDKKRLERMRPPAKGGKKSATKGKGAR